MRFLLTREVGKLATWLRILGFDALYSCEEARGAIIIQALRADRIVITRNRHLSCGRGVRIVVLKSERVQEQLSETVAALGIKLSLEQVFSRCVLCNVALQRIDKETIESRVPDYVVRTQEAFFTCPVCGRLYWRGTHWGAVAAAIRALAGD
ncbi:MAG TPA: Mut7-C RNAse domain-containing protein [Candidatus Omnitrophota bacterium]|nr:Mut7-C RNAse domain-containing protein [Candidatus Omnitrophota bacterium]